MVTEIVTSLDIKKQKQKRLMLDKNTISSAKKSVGQEYRIFEKPLVLSQ